MPQLDVKGQKINYGSTPELNPLQIEQQLYKIDKGPKMLPRKQRFKVWAALLGIGGWFGFCFFLISYRLKSDDLELMEREVYAELETKRKVDDYLKKESAEDKRQLMRRGALDVSRASPNV
mmetsp:Transcript_11703/g.19757  ORF Transcript_11703/g.19757 Transcript_11703/m.19757 type:complete len:121 (-) Transcript_11703:44-406(-)